MKGLKEELEVKVAKLEKDLENEKGEFPCSGGFCAVGRGHGIEA